MGSQSDTTESDSYILAASQTVSEGHHSITEVRPVSEDELAEIEAAIDKISDFQVNFSLYEICAKNYDEILSFYEGVKHRFAETHYIGPDFVYPTLQEMNRLIMNYLTSFRTFLDHRETRYTRLDRQGTTFMGSVTRFSRSNNTRHR